LDQVHTLDGDYDYIIAGAGSAGCVLANRLSADPTKRVLLLEAGGKDNWIWLHIPVGYLFAIGNPRSDWRFQTEPEPGLNGRRINYPRGKVIGGSSSINAMISMRGQLRDYDDWRQLGLTGWSGDEVFATFKRLDNHFLGESEHHGAHGEWRVEQQRLRWDVLETVREAAVQMGIPAIPDFNRGDNEGVSYFQVNQKRGRRWSAARAFLKPVLGRPNLRLEMRAAIDRVLFDGRRAVGIRFTQNGKIFEAHAKGEVILSSGAIGSVEILQRSGVGPGALLQSLGIPVVLEKEGVGANLQDHLQQRMIYKVSGVKTLNQVYYSPLGKAMMGAEYALFRSGPLSMAPSQLGIFTRSSPAHDRANIQFHVQPLSLDKFGDPLHRFAAITVSACNLRPTSRGHVRIRSADFRDTPVIQPNYLSTAEDRQVAADAVRVTRRLVGQQALKKYSPVEYQPRGPISDDTEDLLKAVGEIGTTIFHPVGTAKMGLPSDPGAVVDERLRVMGLKGLRVVDASVMPNIVSGNTNTPTIMIAEKGSGFILADSRAPA
jgi:choline dehydrogenase